MAEGLTLDQQRALARARARVRIQGAAAPAAPQPVVPSTGEDIGRGSASGLFQGGLDLLGSIVNPAGALTQGPQFARTIEDISGRDFYEAQTVPGKVAQTAASVMPMAVAGGGGGAVRKLAADAFRYGAVPGAASEVAGQAAEGTPYETPARIAAGMATGFFTPISRRLTGKPVPELPPPTADELIESGSRGFDAVRRMNVEYRSDAIAGIAQRLRTELYEAGIYPKAAPDTWRILDELAAPPADSVATLSGLEIARRQLRTAGKSRQYPSEKPAAARIRRALDEFVEAADPATVISGPADLAAQVNKSARADYAAGKRSKRLSTLEESAELRAASTYSGQNAENNLRQRAFDVVDPLKPHNREGFSPAELKLIEQVARGTKTRNVLRYVGNLLGGGGGLGAGAAGTAAGAAAWGVGGPFLGIPAFLAAPAIGYGLKKGATNLTRKGFRRADEAVRRRSPLYDHLRRLMPPELFSPEGRTLLGQAGVMQSLQGPRDQSPTAGTPPVIDEIVRALMLQ